jgi:hypothetical protein
MTGLNGRQSMSTNILLSFDKRLSFGAILQHKRLSSSTDPVNFGVICKYSLCLLLSLITNDSTAIDHRFSQGRFET